MSKRLRLSRNKIIAGVCGGIAEYLNLDISLVRILYTLLTIFTAFSGVVVYIILWLIIPESSIRRHY